MKRLELLLFIFCVLFILCHVWGAVAPSHYNWGTQSLAYFGTGTRIALLIAVIAILFLVFREKFLSTLESTAAMSASVPRWVFFIFAVCVLVFIAYEFPSQGLMLGDSKIILLTTPDLSAGAEESANFRNQPLLLQTLRTVQNLSNLHGADGLKTVYWWVDLGAGVLFLGAVFLFATHLKLSALEKFLIFIFLMGGGGVQFFFGYIENYALLYACTAGYIVTGWLALRKKIPYAIPILLVCVMVGLHLGALIFLPTSFIFFFAMWQENKRKFMLIGTAVLIGMTTISLLSNYDLRRIIQRGVAAFQYDILPLTQPTGDFAYAMFSPLHIITWVNLILLVAPFGIIPVVIFLVFSRHVEEMRTHATMFLFGVVACGLAFTFIMNPALGMFRDWDLMASFLLPSIFLSAWLVSNKLYGIHHKRILTFMTVLVVLHTALRIGINADEDKHLARAEVLTNPKFMSRFAQILYYDRLANAFWERKDYPRTKKWYERYITLDSTNPRIIANLSEVYRKLHQPENTFAMLKRAASLGSKDPLVFSNLGYEYQRHGDTLRTIEALTNAITLNPNHPIPHVNLGLIYMSKKEYQQAAIQFEKSISLGMQQPDVYKYAGDANFASHDFSKALNYYNSYLHGNPDDSSVLNKINTIKKIKHNSETQKKPYAK